MADVPAGYLGYNGSLFRWGSAYPGELTPFGTHFRDYVRDRARR
jgi:hypothetical protein